MTVLTKEVLEKSGCETPNCGHDHSTLFLVSRCHPNDGVEVSYDKKKGTLVIRCNTCEAEVAEVAVANKLPI